MMVELRDEKLGRIGLWAPGDYFNECAECGKQFLGDKRARQCRSCAIVQFLRNCRGGPSVHDEYNGANLGSAFRVAADEIDFLNRHTRADQSAQIAELRAALAAIGAMPSGYCFCFNDERNPDKDHHTGECLAARAALKNTERDG